MNVAMKRAYQILNTFTDEELNGFIMMFGKREVSAQPETKEERIARKRAAADKIIAGRPILSPNFNEKQELLDYLDERYGI